MIQSGIFLRYMDWNSIPQRSTPFTFQVYIVNVYGPIKPKVH